jgi:4-alpha-glucanotransferase
LLTRDDVPRPDFPANKVDYGPVIDYKIKLLTRAWENFKAGRAPALRVAFDQFRAEQASWLDDYGLFMALKDAHGGVSWLEWEDDARLRQPAALARARKTMADAVEAHEFRQFLFFRQWFALKAYANQKNLRLIGDAPIFVASDSSDVWANPALFLLDEERCPTVVAGVPPDYFSATGQLWGNPLYDWAALKQTGYAWWVARLRATLAQVDLVRIDHFRGFEAYWEVPAGMPTAEKGRWVKGPGADLFEALTEALGDPSTSPSTSLRMQLRASLPVIAEDLGVITPEVDALRTRFNLPGMRVLQFAFGGATEDRFLPHNYENTNTVVYTGTHDNDTTRGWYETISEQERDFVRRYLARDGREIAWDMIRLAWSSVADYAVAPLQDVMELGTEARMNLPGRPSGNWQWRFVEGQLTREKLDRLGELTELFGR